MTHPKISTYLAKIGRKGGRKSKRQLDPATAKKMVLVREARRAYKKYHAQCFWSYDPHLLITSEQLNWVGRQLLNHGGMKLWELGNKLCQ